VKLLVFDHESFTMKMNNLKNCIS